MEVKSGYKQTEVGVIPVVWDVKTIDQVSFVTSGKRLPLGCSLVGHQTPHPYVRVTDMRLGTVSLSEIKFVPESVFPAIKRYRIFCDDIFISVAGTLGIVGKVPIELDGANLTENADRITKISCSQDYLLHVLMSPLIQNTIDSIHTVGAQPKLALTRIRKFVIPVPPLTEQRAIATTLSDVGALLDALDLLIAKKRDLKQAAMQQLLTGQTRLPGFEVKPGYKQTEVGVIPEDWEVKSMDFMTSLMTNGFVGTATSAYVTGDDGVLYIQGYNVKEAGFNFHGIKRVSKLFHAQHQKSCLREGDLLTIQTGDIGVTTIVPPELVGANCHALVISRFIPWTSDSRFYCHYFNSERGRAEFKKIETGTTMKHLNVGDMKPLLLPTPPLPEQTAIAEVLSEMDAELTGLEQRREKTASLKQGMMQELLTGKTRLIKLGEPNA